ncbi:MAG: hypothetical protein WDO71_25865 [Bacteroidota bacterium]
MQSSGTAAITAPNGARENFVVDGVIADGAGGFTKKFSSSKPPVILAKGFNCQQPGYNRS